MTTYVYDFVFTDADIANGNKIITIDENNPVIQGYSGFPELTGDTAFYAELNRVLGNLHLIRYSQPHIGTLVSYVTDTAGATFKLTLV